MFYMVLYDNENDLLLYLGLGIFGLCVIINLIIFIVSLFTRYKYIDLNTKINNDLSKYIIKMNKEFFNKNGLTCRKGYRSFWIEIIKNN